MKFYLSIIVILISCTNLYANDFTNCTSKILETLEQIDALKDKSDANITLNQLLQQYNTIAKDCAKQKNINKDQEYLWYRFWLDFELANLCYLDKDFKKSFELTQYAAEVLPKITNKEAFDNNDIYNFTLLYIENLHQLEIKDFSHLNNILKYADYLKKSDVEIYYYINVKIVQFLIPDLILSVSQIHHITQTFNQNELDYFQQYADYLVKYTSFPFDFDDINVYKATALPFIINVQKAIQQKNDSLDLYVNPLYTLCIPGQYLRNPINYIYIALTDYFLVKEDYLQAMIYIGTLSKYTYLFQETDKEFYQYIVDTYNLCASKLNRTDLIIQKQ